MSAGVGHFVWSPDEWGVGKILAFDGRTATVSFFHSIARAERRTYPQSTLRPAKLDEQTRVHWRDPETGDWQVGRVTGPTREPHQRGYWVTFPNHRELPLPEEQLFARCWNARVEPTEVLALAGLETQFLHDRRLGAIQAFLHLRAASHGMTSLLSSAIDLVPHQVEVVRRVLEDPVQRYLLADEVGLGKTIEAGVIIRQCLLDRDVDRVAVLAPRPLVHQWESELQDKFAISDFGDRVQVLPFEDLDQLPRSGLGLLVVDEAHHLVGPEGSSGVGYRALAAVAHGSRRLLLLSATPVLGNESTYLALLHLLDGVTYRLDAPEEFSQRVALRREYANNLVRLRPNQHLVRLRGIKENLQRLFPLDGVVMSHSEHLDDEDAEVRMMAIRAIKRHVAETYRLQQRLLRTRRKDTKGWELRPRVAVLTVDVDEDERMANVCAALEEWRRRAVRAIEVAAEEGHDTATVVSLRASLIRRYVCFFEAASGGLETLAAELMCQREALACDRISTFDEDIPLLDDLRTALNDEHAAESDRLQVAVGAVELTIRTLRARGPGDVPKLVAFASGTETARATYERLIYRRQLGRDNTCLLVEGMPVEVSARTVERFRRSRQPSVLVCDRAGEEGLNLAFADCLLHLDLPLSPSRMEQRIGRLDRYGREQPQIRHRFILPSDDTDSPWLAWKELLDKGFGVFSRSLSEVQFVLDDVETTVVEALFERGAHGLRQLVEDVKSRLEQARADLDRDAELDRMELDQHDLSPMYEAIDEADTDEERFIRPLSNWWHDVLQLTTWRDESRADAFLLGWAEKTLLPRHPWEAAFRDGLRRPLSFRRHVAVHDPSVRLVRPGVPFVDQQQRFLDWDDRGTAFATWRQTPAWPSAQRNQWLGFKLAYVVEPAADAAIALAGSALAAALRRRLDGLFSPWLHVLYVDLAQREVDDPSLMDILARGYHTGVGGAHRDYNLGSRREALYSVVDSGRWAALCGEMRIASERLLRCSELFQHRARAAAQRAESELRERNERLRRRATALFAETGTQDRSTSEEIRINDVILDVVGTPVVRLDAIGFFVVTDGPPPQGADGWS